MVEQYKITVDSKKFEAELKKTDLQMPIIARRMMGKIATEIRKDIRQNKLKGQTLKKGTGGLYKSISFKTSKNWEATIIVSAKYASSMEKGANILPKKGKYLTFKINDEWKKVTGVTLPARPYLMPTVDKFFTDGSAEKWMQFVLQKALDKEFEK